MAKCPAWVLGIAVVALASNGCGIIGPSCISRQTRGAVAAVAGEVGAGAVVSHVVRYGAEGSQNDAHIGWPDQHASGGPRIRVYATRMECAEFMPPGPPGVLTTNAGPCASVGSRSGFMPPAAGCGPAQACDVESNLVQSGLTVTHGRGNPEILGSPPQYKLWVVGDPARSVRYTIDITSFYGPDC